MRGPVKASYALHSPWRPPHAQSAEEGRSWGILPATLGPTPEGLTSLGGTITVMPEAEEAAAAGLVPALASSSTGLLSVVLSFAFRCFFWALLSVSSTALELLLILGGWSQPPCTW